MVLQAWITAFVAHLLLDSQQPSRFQLVRLLIRFVGLDEIVRV